MVFQFPQMREIWIHGKSGVKYEIITLARVESDPSQVLVVYRGCEDYKTWSRGLGDFIAPVNGGTRFYNEDGNFGRHDPLPVPSEG